ncbi:MAG: hypothetical protein ACF8NJ_02065 [Phycisphaerales bacterium JB038]
MIIGLALLLAVALALPAGLWTRWRLRRWGERCPRCGYDRTHSPSAQCSECGLPRSGEAYETALHRRELRLALPLGVNFVAIVVLWVTFISTVSYPQPLQSSPALASVPRHWLTEFDERVTYLTPNWPTPRWRVMWNRMQWQEHRRADEIKLLQKCLAKLNREGLLLRTRSLWPRQVNPAVELAPSNHLVHPYENFFLATHPYQLEVCDTHGNVLGQRWLANANYGDAQFGSPWNDQAVEAPWPPASQQGSMEFLVRLRETKQAAGRGSLAVGKVVASETVTLQIQRVDATENVLRAIPDEAVTEALQARTRLRLDWTPSRVWMEIIIPEECHDRPFVTALQATIEHQEAVVATARFLCDFTLRHGETTIYEVDLVGDLPQLMHLYSTGAELTARITGDGESALRDPDAKAYWEGEVVLPVTPLPDLP